jgi:hypothetical protein
MNNLNITGRLKTAIGNEASNLNILQGDGMEAVNSMIRAIPTNEDESNEQIIRRPVKTMKVDNLIGKKKMKKPVGKLTSMKPIMGEDGETTEATGAGSAGGYVAPLFTEPKRVDSMFKDEQPKKKVKGGFVYENKEKLKGGKADKKTFQDLVNKNKQKGKDIGLIEKELKKQLNKGIKVEMEHTDDRGKAKEIAMDHLFEDPKYYDKLQKIEATEATSTASSGQYSTPKMWAKSMNKKDFRGASKPQIPGGKFVQVKKKCKTFPYCNQGDIKALNIFENETLKKVISKVSREHNISENVIKTILTYEYEKIKQTKNY